MSKLSKKVLNAAPNGGLVENTLAENRRKTRFAQLDYIAKENPSVAERLDEDIDRQIDRLADNPGVGRDGRVSGTREMVIARTPYIAVYRVKARRVEILRILHGAQQWPRQTKK